MTTTLDRVRELNYDHHRRMTELHEQRVATGVNGEIANIDEQSYRALLAPVPQCQQILELGSASGGQWPLLEQWLRDSGEIWGIDLYEPLVTQAQQRGLKIALGFVEDMNMYPDNAFDLVCSRHVMEHLGDLERGVAEILRVTRPGGYIAQVTPNMAFDPEPAHLNALDAAGWRAVWEATGAVTIIEVMRHEFHGGEVHVVVQKR